LWYLRDVADPVRVIYDGRRRIRGVERELVVIFDKPGREWGEKAYGLVPSRDQYHFEPPDPKVGDQVWLYTSDRTFGYLENQRKIRFEHRRARRG
jgi:hypothetical protein